MSIDFSKLPPPNLIEEIEFEQILAERKASFIARYPVEEQPEVAITVSRESEPVTKLLEEVAYLEMLLRNKINKRALAMLVAFATGGDLDHLAAGYGVQRLVVSPADNTVVPPVPAVMELDEALRQRIPKAFDRLSVAGPEEAYIYHALSADGRVGDVTAVSPNPAEALITISQLDSGTGEASPELISIVANALNSERVRPIGDRVTVQSAQVVNYSINARLYVDKMPENSTALQTAIDNATAFASARKRLGRSVHLSVLYSLLQIEGVKRVDLISPSASVVITPQQVANCTSINVTMGIESP
jgi:phage-related baseplate assembly protein